MIPEDTRKLLVEADSFISHMRYRGSWPTAREGDLTEVDRLIGRLRTASQRKDEATEETPARERLSAESISELIAIGETLNARVALLLAYYLDSDDPAVAEAFVLAFPREESPE
jgi:hypothetical protein